MDRVKVEARLERRVGFGAVNLPWESDFRGSSRWLEGVLVCVCNFKRGKRRE